MKLAVDVHYFECGAVAAGVLFWNWQDAHPQKTVISKIDQVQDYIPGQFFKRELPCIIKLIEEHDLTLECIVIDGYVFLDGHSRPGLGKILYDHLKKSTPVIGVAKTAFQNISGRYEIQRGASKHSLYITSVGISLKEAKQHILSMHGEHRIPTLLKTADQQSRGRDR